MTWNNYNNQKDEENFEELRGTISRVTFRSDSNGYSVIKITCEESSEEVTAVGYCLQYQVGTPLQIKGQYVHHPRFGKQLQATTASEVEPDTPDAIKKYLGSGLIKGVGSKTAERIVNRFGKDTLNILRTDPDQVARVPGIGASKAKLIAEGIAERSERLETEKFFIDLGAGLALTAKIYQKFESDAVDEFKKDPYILSSAISGVGFLTADRLAQEYGFPPDSPQRLKAGLLYTLEKAADSGHCYLPLDRLLADAQRRDILGAPPDGTEGYDFTDALDLLYLDPSIRKEEQFSEPGQPPSIYLSRLHSAEEFVAEFIAARTEPFQHWKTTSEEVDKSLQIAEHNLGVEFNAEQQQAVLDAVQYPLVVITGGPGCGKTTVIRALTRTFERAGCTMALAAPTGKAAQRMADVCGVSASTIHRLLKYEPVSGKFQYGINRPLKIESGDGEENLVDVVIVDEASMLDVILARHLFAAIPPSATLILVGDKDQLPSVGPGRVFDQLVTTECVRTVKLTQLYRRSAESDITTTAHMVNSGIAPQFPSDEGEENKEVYFFNLSDQEKMAETVEELIADKIESKFGISREDTLVLTPSNRGILGTEQLNNRLQERLNPVRDSRNILKSGDREIRKGDKICQRKNNYYLHPLGVFNGDQGTVYSIDHDQGSLVVDLWDGRLIEYTAQDVSQLSLSYALTIHRSQGSESECVVLLIDRSHYALLDRTLLYTGITRAKKVLIIVGSKSAFQIALKRTMSRQRFTLLKERVASLTSSNTLAV